MGVWYTSREAVKSATDFAETARNNGQVDRAIEAASRAVEGLLKRRFYPWTGTRTFDWPHPSQGTPWRLWLDQHELVSATTVTAGGTTVSSSDYLLRPDDGPPFTHVEIDLASSAAYSSGDSHQRAIAIEGVWGHLDEAEVGALGEALDGSETAVDVNGPAAAAAGVGSILRVGSERMTVTGRRMTDTGQNTAADLAASKAAETVAVADGTGFAVGELLLVGAERMLVVDIAGNSLIVKRAFDGSTLASHSSGTDVYASRTLTVTRGVLGTTAAAHDDAATVYLHRPPGLVVALATGEAVNLLQQESAGYARTVGTGENQREATGRGLRQLRADAVTAHGRKGRVRTV